MADKIWLPPLEVCCQKVNRIIIHVFGDGTLHFKSDCPIHGVKGIKSPLVKSAKLDYTIKVSDSLEREFQKGLFDE